MAGRGVGNVVVRHVCRFHMARWQGLSHRNFNVRQKGVMERNHQVDKILKKYFVCIEKCCIFAR